MDNTENRASRVFSKSSQIMLLVGFCLLGFAAVFFSFNIFSIALTICFIITPLIAIAGNILLFLKTRKPKPVILILSEAFVLVFLGARCLPYLYSSPALSPKNEKIYSAFIEFSDNEPCRDLMELDGFGRFYVNNQNYDIFRSDPDHLQAVFIKEKWDEIRHISHRMRKANIYNAVRKDEWVLFFRLNVPNRPRSIGVLYSQDGRNPNESNDDYLKKYGPYYKINKHWYTSEQLSNNCRTIFPLPVPDQSLINCSEIK